MVEQIEKGIPIPVAHTRSLTGTLRQMEIGDSLVIPKRKSNSVPQLAKQAGVRVATRSISDDEVRVWRIA